MFFVYSAEVTGTGCAKDKNTAKKYALDDLSSQIRVRVESELYMVTSQSGAKSESYVSHKIRLTSDLNIQEYSLNYTERNGTYCANVSIPKDRLPVYQKKAASIVKEINSYTEKAGKIKLDSQKTDLLQKALDKYNELENYDIIVRFLGGEPPAPDMDRADIKSELVRMQRVSSDISQIAKNIMSKMGNKSAYVNPVRLYGSAAITPFAALLTQQMRAYGTMNQDAAYQLHCQYSPEGDPFAISCELKFNGAPDGAFVTAVSTEVCKQTNCESSASMKRMEQMFGTPGAGLFRGYFYTNYGDAGVMLREGDVLTLYARLSEEADLAVIFINEGKAALFPLSEKKPVIRIAGKLTNNEVEVIKLKVTPPFGTDTLIFAAYKGEMDELLPKYRYDKDSGLYVTDETPEALLERFRKVPKDRFIEKIMVFNTEPAR